MTAWPGGLPLPRAAGAGYQIGRGAIRYEVDAGPAQQAPVTTAVFDTLNLVYPCSKAQRGILDGFFRGEAKQGGVWFDFTHPFSLVAGKARFKVGTEPKVTSAAPKFDVAVVLEFAA